MFVLFKPCEFTLTITSVELCIVNSFSVIPVSHYCKSVCRHSYKVFLTWPVHINILYSYSACMNLFIIFIVYTLSQIFLVDSLLEIRVHSIFFCFFSCNLVLCQLSATGGWCFTIIMTRSNLSIYTTYTTSSNVLTLAQVVALWTFVWISKWPLVCGGLAGIDYMVEWCISNSVLCDVAVVTIWGCLLIGSQSCASLSLCLLASASCSKAHKTQTGSTLDSLGHCT